MMSDIIDRRIDRVFITLWPVIPFSNIFFVIVSVLNVA